MTNHPNRKPRPGSALVYVDEQMQTVEYTDSRSTAGYGSGPEYRVAYRLADGRWMRGTRHTDRGNLMTGVTYATTAGIG